MHVRSFISYDIELPFTISWWVRAVTFHWLLIFISMIFIMKRTARTVLYVVLSVVALVVLGPIIGGLVGGVFGGLFGGLSAAIAGKHAAKDAKKEVVVVHGASWCGWSKKMMGEFDDTKKKLAKHGVHAKAVEDKSSEGRELAKKHGIDGYPTTLVKKDGKVVGKIGGFRKSDDMVKEVNKHM